MVGKSNLGLAEIQAEIESLQALKKERAKQARADLGDAVLKALAEDPEENPMHDSDVASLAKEIRDSDPSARRKKRGRKAQRKLPEITQEKADKRDSVKTEKEKGEAGKPASKSAFVRTDEKNL